MDDEEVDYDDVLAQYDEVMRQCQSLTKEELEELCRLINPIDYLAITRDVSS